MSDDLQDQLGHEPQELGPEFVIVIAERITQGAVKPVVGALRTVLFDTEPEIEFRVMLSDAFSVINSVEQFFRKFEFQYAGETITLPGPFVAKAARIQDVEPKEHMCVLALSLKKAQSQQA